jgi:hypothetical protein
MVSFERKVAMSECRWSTSRKVVLALVAGGALLAAGCKKEEPAPPLPANTTPPAPPPAPLELAPEPEVQAQADANADQVKKGTGKPGPSLKACCAALRQNAQNAPPPNNDYMLQAASLCDGLVAQGQQAGTILTAIQGALKGAGMPLACH